ncbi:DUF305 domain-containing protein [Mycolicibacterium pyrenivorans]|uniref:DUF305 domain-containing protein n=1 Tax=Mycolicibacterium pyrenivorans TaxID=187102 RepID=UPI0021F39680|nr:DUF305 domain-containing protein [Mycolicibacterium pyrenivorans]MCV7154046.1 DUF305 domain-containing protein [Mycolicibacterium pyrenivorans]
MQHSRLCFVAATAVAATLTLSACGGSGNDPQTSAATSAAPSSAATGSDSAQDHNDSDVMFTQGMIPHHQQAIEMSDMLLAKPDIAPDVVTLANDIKAAQSPEIEQMQGWLDQWGVSGAMPPGEMPADMPGHDMPAHEMPGGGGMPAMTGHGMMSQADMAALRDAQGTEASRLYLTHMITHHEGAIMMAQQETDGGKYPQALELARAIMDSQQKEITTMREMLDAM